jgi:hypothetical protein
MQRTTIALLILLLAVFLSGCASLMTNTYRYNGTREMLASRDTQSAIKRLESRKTGQYRHKDRVVKYLDLGMLYHYQGDYVKSNQFLEKAELAMEQLYTKSVSKAALSLLLNDNALDYFGEDYEDIYTNVFKALNYLHLDLYDDAFVEIRRINEKLARLEDKNVKLAEGFDKSKARKAEITAGTNKFTSSALGSYLSMSLYRQENLPDDARIDYDKILSAFASEPEIYDFPLPAISDSSSIPQEPILHVLAMVGTSPYKVSKELHIATEKDLLVIASVDENVDIAPIFWPGIDTGYYFKFALPAMVNDTTKVAEVIVRVDGNPYQLEKLEDIGKVAVSTFAVREPIIYLKTITRAVVKGVLAEEMQKQIEKKNPGIGGFALSLLTGAAIYMTENADLRTSRFFPNAVLVSDIPLPAGEHNIAIEYYDQTGNLLYTDDRGRVNISGNSLNLIESWDLQ